MSRIVIFANGILNHPEQLRRRLRPTDRLFCADGGTNHVLSLGLTPEAIIGDLDSLDSELISQMEAKGVIFHRHPARKDKTDLELALDIAIQEQPDEILVVTALGGRLDQMLANLLLLTRSEYAAPRLTLIEGSQQATLLRSNQSISIDGQAGDTISVVPLTSQVEQVDLTGVEWPLEQATLSRGSTWSISNVLTASPATLKIGKGLAWLIHIGGGYQENQG